MPTYLVESYLPQARANAAATVAALAAGGAGARHRWSLVLADEDLCLHVLEGPSAAVVREATVRAALRCQRISRVVLITSEHPIGGLDASSEISHIATEEER
jgi:hypothetical protein